MIHGIKRYGLMRYEYACRKRRPLLFFSTLLAVMAVLVMG